MATNLAGISDTTRKKLELYEQGYTPSQAVVEAQNYYNTIKSQRPGEYVDKYATQLNDLYNQIVNRKEFTYDLSNDALYQNAKQQYQVLGKQAMQDTMGQASAMTGGYGSSYASTAGNQAYQSYLRQLNDNIGDYYQLALSKYKMDTDDLNNKYGITKDLSDTDYSRYQDAYSRWSAEYDRAYNAFNNERNFDYTGFTNDRNYWSGIANSESSNYWNSVQAAQRASSSSGGSGGSSKASTAIIEKAREISAQYDGTSKSADKVNKELSSYINALVDTGNLSAGDGTSLYSNFMAKNVFASSFGNYEKYLMKK